MAIQRTHVSAEEFDQFVVQPENINRLFELIHGEIVEVVSNGYSSILGARLAGRLSIWADTFELGWVTGADGGYMINGERYIPDVAYISKAKRPTPSYDGYNPIAPDLAVEVLSPGNAPLDMRVKIFNYGLAGTVVWVVDPDTKLVEVYTPGQAAQVLTIEDTLDGGTLLPNFTLALKDLFKE